MYGTGYPQDPYQGGGFGPGMGMPAPRRPSSPKVLGILSIVFGSIVVLFSLFGLLAGQSMMGVYDDFPGGHDAAQRFMDSTRGVSIVNSLLFAVMSIALIIVGTMQLKYKRVAVKASIIWGAVALAVLAVTVVLTFTVVNPAMDRLMDEMSGQFGGAGGMFSGLGAVGAVGSIFFYSPYPIVLIILFTRPKVQEACVN